MSNDYLMQQIEDMVKLLASVIFTSQPAEPHAVFDLDGNFSVENFLYYRLKKMVLEGEVLEAEQLLFTTIEADPQPAYLSTALAFYDELEQMNDAKLASLRTNRKSILLGLQKLHALYPQT